MLFVSSYRSQFTPEWHWSKVLKKFVKTVEFGLVYLNTSIAGELVATRRVSHWQVASSL